ncbi:hypothetical protein CAPN010_04830 [Capnocytophaga cynodegmi]|nr:hypothetical protein [Capnocytophaga cynodegmi]GJQ06325.1 hypothetical protein CAPN010_04830 [Capnocytophaga cynodegmi]
MRNKFLKEIEWIYSKNRPSFDEIITTLEKLKQEINNLKLEF